MGEIITAVLGAIFLFLSLMHFAWAVGIKWGFEASLPTNAAGQKVISPKPRDSVIVGAGLGFFAAFYLSKNFGIQVTPNKLVEQVVSWIIPSIFVLRALGDFKYFGFFKKVRTTAFSRLDTHFIIPLCISIALLGYLLGGWLS